MSATTMAVATITETVDPAPGSRRGNAELSVSNAAIGVQISRLRQPFLLCGLTLANSRRVSRDLDHTAIRYFDTFVSPHIALSVLPITGTRDRLTIRTRFRGFNGDLTW